MTDVENLTLEVLKDIRAEIKKTNERLDTTNERLDSTVQRLDALERRQAATEIRLATELTSVVAAIHDLKLTIVEGLELKKQVDDHERRLATLEHSAAHERQPPYGERK